MTDHRVINSKDKGIRDQNLTSHRVINRRADNRVIKGQDRNKEIS